ncbi:MAG: DUF1667 domain-containing protein [Erysipelotrichaceae bacterium]|nr:DUF1667 domain-containing protein [Erysipelotrichaceae bacterium]
MEELICITCPKGCTLQVEVEQGKVKSITGNSCPRGIVYAENEILHPMRMITSTVRIDGASIARCPVMTSKPVPKEKIFDIMHEIEQIRVNAPVQMNQILKENLCGLDIHLIATRTLNKK